MRSALAPWQAWPSRRAAVQDSPNVGAGTDVADAWAGHDGDSFRLDIFSEPAPQTRVRKTSRAVWVVFGVLLALYVFSAWRTNPVATFGTAADDALYFSSAKALASGQGYIFPSFPIHLRATRFPELYPLLLAGIWKLDPHFPGNVRVAAGLTLAFGCLALLFAFLLLRRWPALDDWQALGIVGLCAFTGYFLSLSASVLTDVPFMAVMLGAVWLAEVAFERSDGSDRAIFGAGLLAGLSVGLRSLGMAVVLGIGLFLLRKRDWRRVIWFSVAAAPLAMLWFWPALVGLLHPSGAHAVSATGSSGWAQTVCYYTSYSCSWRMGVSGQGTLMAVVIGNLKAAFQTPGYFLLSPLATGYGLWSVVLVSLLGFACYAGVFRSGRSGGWKPLHFVFGIYLLVLMPWPYPSGRFLIIFFPLLLAGIWLEGRRMAKLVLGDFRPRRFASETVAAGFLAVTGGVLAASLAANYAIAIPSYLGGNAAANERLLADERGAYSWIRQYAPAEASIIAGRDGLAFLYTDHRAVVPIGFLPQSFYATGSRYIKEDSNHIADVARHIGATYWLVTAADFHLDGHVRSALQKAQLRVLADAPILYQSGDDAVRLYEVGRVSDLRKADRAQSAKTGGGGYAPGQGAATIADGESLR